MTVLKITPGLPPVWGPYGEVDDGARYFTAAGVGPLSDPYEQRTAITLHSVNGRNLTRTTAESFFRNHFTKPGDRPTTTGERHWGVSYHVVVGADGSIVVALDERAGTLSAGSLANQRFVHIVLMLGNWQTITPQHELVLEAVAQFVAPLCIGFKIPPRWCAVDRATSPNVSAEERMANALLLINDTRTPIGLLGHRDITAAYQLLRNHPDARIRARAARIRNSHSDVQYFPGHRFADRVRQIIEGDDMARLVHIYEDTTWLPYPCTTMADVAAGRADWWLLNGAECRPVSADRAAKLVAAGTARLDPNGKPGGLWRSQLTAFDRPFPFPAGYQPEWFGPAVAA